MNIIKKLLFLFFFFLIVPFANAQFYLKKKTQHRFAQSYIGLNTQIVPSSGQLFWKNSKQAFPFQTVPRFTIVGLHFWGLIDFNMNIPLGQISEKKILEDGEVELNTGADLSVRYYPWRVKYGTFRPFFGVSFNEMIMELGNTAEGTRADLFVTTSLLAGLVYTTKNGWRINAELMFLPNNKRDFYSSRENKHVFELPRQYFSLGFIKYFEGTIHEEKPKESGLTKKLETKLLAENKLNSLSIGIAPSGSYFMPNIKFSDELKSIPRHTSNFNWDFGLGYLFHKEKIHIGLSYRTYVSNAESFNLEHIIRREALAFEVFKFLWDYNGFVPNAGLSLSAERWATGLFIDDVQQGETNRSRILSPG
ncbi:MAG: hypothetical protein GW823_00410, partial [Bacteroidetes bacterium]|nr:hypothetical protein [Bacteroidota bacterium]